MTKYYHSEFALFVVLLMMTATAVVIAPIAPPSECDTLCPNGMYPPLGNKTIFESNTTCDDVQQFLVSQSIPLSLFSSSCDVIHFIGVLECGCDDTLPNLPTNADCLFCQNRKTNIDFDSDLLGSKSCRDFAFLVSETTETCAKYRSLVEPYCGCNNTISEDENNGTLCRVCGNFLGEPSRVIDSGESCLAHEIRANEKEKSCVAEQDKWAESCCLNEGAASSHGKNLVSWADFAMDVLDETPAYEIIMGAASFRRQEEPSPSQAPSPTPLPAPTTPNGLVMNCTTYPNDPMVMNCTLDMQQDPPMSPWEKFVSFFSDHPLGVVLFTWFGNILCNNLYELLSIKLCLLMCLAYCCGWYHKRMHKNNRAKLELFEKENKKYHYRPFGYIQDGIVMCPNTSPTPEVLSRALMLSAENSGMTGPTIAVDVGTTYCRVAVWQDGKVKIAQDKDGVMIATETVSSFIRSNKQLGSDAQKILVQAKRLLGRDFDEAKRSKWPFDVVEGTDGKASFKVICACDGQEHVIDPQKVISLLMKKVKQRFGAEISNVVVTVPVSFTSFQRKVMKQSASTGGFNVVHLMNDTTAAALSSSLHTRDRAQNVIFVGFHGGNLSVSVVCLDEGTCAVKAATGVDITDMSDQDASATGLQKYLEDFKRALVDSDLAMSDIHKITLFGGQSHAMEMGKLIRNHFVDVTPPLEVLPEQAVVHGAAIQAGILSGTEMAGRPSDYILNEIITSTLGVKLEQGGAILLIRRNSQLPSKERCRLTLSPGEVSFSILDIERNSVAGVFKIHGIPSPKPGLPFTVIEAVVTVDINGIISVSVYEKDSQLEKQLTVSLLN